MRRGSGDVLGPRVASEWEPIAFVDPPVTRFEFRDDEGLVVEAAGGATKVTPAKPGGLPGGDVERYNARFEGDDRYPFVTLAKTDAQFVAPKGHAMRSFRVPPPPGEPLDVADFLLVYPPDWDSQAFLSYALFRDGRVMCAQRYVKVGPEAEFDSIREQLERFVWTSVISTLVAFVALSALVVFLFERRYRGERALA